MFIERTPEDRQQSIAMVTREVESLVNNVLRSFLNIFSGTEFLRFRSLNSDMQLENFMQNMQ
jgi:hypothetical protein